MNAREASVVLSFGGLGLFMLGRFAGSWIMGRVRAEKMLMYLLADNIHHIQMTDCYNNFRFLGQVRFPL